MFDIRKCYRCIHTSTETNSLRLIPIWSNDNDDKYSAIHRFTRMLFGDIPASSILLLSYAHFVLPLLSSPLSSKVLVSLHVDDSLSGSRIKES